MGLSISINFSGDCKEAIAFYEKVFASKANGVMTYGDIGHSSDPNFEITEDMKSLIASASINIAGNIVMLNDMPTNFKFIKGNNIFINLSYNKLEEMQEVFENLSESGTVDVPLTEIPGVGCAGMISDKFGLVWQFSLEK